MANKNIKLNLDYSGFSGGISECQSKMRLLNQQFKLQEAELGNNASRIDMLSLSEDTLNKKIQLQTQILNETIAKSKAMRESGEATTTQIERAHSAILKQSTVLSQLNNELELVTDELKQLEEEENNVAESSENLGNAVQSSTTSFMEVVSTISAVSSALSSLKSAFIDSAASSAKFADDVETMATQYGLTADQIQRYIAIQEEVDVSADQIASSMSRLTREMGNAENGSASAQQKFKELGISITGANGHLRDSEDVFFEVINALGNMDNASERDAAAMELLGKSAQQLNPLIEMGSEAFLELADSADVLNSIEIDNLSNLDTAFNSLNNAMDLAENKLMAALAPALTRIIDTIADLDPAVLGTVVVIGKMMSVMSSLAPVITMLSTSTMAAAASNTTLTATEYGKVTADVAATGSTMALNAALLPQIVTILAIVAALALLAYAVYAIVDAFNDEADAANNANASMEQLKNTTSSLSTSGMSGMASSATSYMASGSTYGGAGGLTWVGEQGAELVNLPYGSTVYNHEESKSMTSSSTNVFNVTIDAKNVNDFNKVVQVFSGLGQSMNRGGLVNG